MVHIPVLQKEVIEYLNPQPNENFIDCTIGEAGHTLAILENTSPNGKVLGIDADPELIRNLKSTLRGASSEIRNFEKRILLISDNFVNLHEIVKHTKFGSVSGILFDLGMSSWHLEESDRGFSFLKREPLDMRYNPQNPLTAEKILNFWSEQEIEKILSEYGEERFSKTIAKDIVRARKFKPIENTSQLVEIIRGAISFKSQHQRIHFATRTFQALRIAVNDELNNLETVLPQAIEVLKPGGRLAVISFHSLEDRIVKNFLREHSDGLFGCKILTKKPTTPSQEEIKINPRARSAKLRAAIKIK